MKLRQSVVVFSASLVLAGCSFNLAQDVTPPPGFSPDATIAPAATASEFPLLPPDPQNGQTIYQSECASCHGNDGKGAGVSTSTTSHSVIKTDDAAFSTSLVNWYDAITNHATNSTMPDFAGVVDERDRWDISAYLYLINLPAGSVTSGREVYEIFCISCHGETGKGDGENAAGLAIQPPDFAFERILSPRSDQELYDIVMNGSSGVMPGFSAMLKDQDARSVVSFIRSLSFASSHQSVKIDPTPSDQVTAVLTPGAEAEPEETPPAQVDKIQVSGKVVNDSGAALPAGLQVTLKIFDSLTETDALVTDLAADGSYAFADIPMNPDRIVLAVVEYNGQTFNSEPSRLPETSPELINTSPELQLDIHISDSTSDLSAVSVDRLHVFFDFSRDGVVQVVQLFLFSNNSNKTIVPPADGQPLLFFSLPSGATNLQFEDSAIGERYISTDTGFADTASIPPGEDSLQVLYAYDLPYTNKADISLTMPYDVSSVIVMAPESGIRFKSSQLVDGGIRNTSQSTFRVYNGSDFTIGSQLKFSLSGRPDAQSETVGGLKLDTVVIGAIGLLAAILAAGLYLFQRRKILQKNLILSQDHQKLDKDGLMDAIIALDEQYKNGKMGEAAYRQRRAELKEQLQRML